MRRLVLVAAISAILGEIIFVAVLLWNGRITGFDAQQIGSWLGGTLTIWLFSLVIGFIAYFVRRNSGDPNRGQLSAFIAALAFAGLAIGGAMR